MPSQKELVKPGILFDILVGLREQGIDLSQSLYLPRIAHYRKRLEWDSNPRVLGCAATGAGTNA